MNPTPFNDVPTIPLPLRKLPDHAKEAPSSRKSPVFNLAAVVVLGALALGAKAFDVELMHDVAVGLGVCAALALGVHLARKR